MNRQGLKEILYLYLAESRDLDRVMAVVDKYCANSNAGAVQQQCNSSMHEYVSILLENVLFMKSKTFKNEREEGYLSGQELICSLILQKINESKDTSQSKASANG